MHDETFLLIITAAGWILAMVAAALLFEVSRSLGRAARANKRLLDENFCLGQSVRFWKSLAQPLATSRRMTDEEKAATDEFIMKQFKP